MIYLNGLPVNTTMFPDKTCQIWKLPEETLKHTNFAHVKWTFDNEGEFLQLAQLKMLLDHYGFETTLRLTYLPYGRQDKEVSNSTTFALRTFTKLLNSLRFDNIICMDPHSSVADDLIFNFQEIYPTEEVHKVIADTKTDLLCFPDKGALSKYAKIYRDIPHIYGEKVRDQLTGTISHYKLFGYPDIQNVLIVDDICDGGATFKLLASDLIEAGAKEVNLFVTHGIFSKGTSTLFDSGIKRIFTQYGEVTGDNTPTWQL